MTTLVRRTGWGLLAAAVAVGVTACGIGGNGSAAATTRPVSSAPQQLPLPGESAPDESQPPEASQSPAQSQTPTKSQPPQRSAGPGQSRSPGESTTTPVSSSTARAPLATAQETLSRKLRQGEDEYVVAVTSGYDAIIFDNVGDARFLHSNDGMNWIFINSSHYRYVKNDAAGQKIKVTGQVPQRADHATFILRGTFSGDGTGRMMAFSYGGKFGWGAVIAKGRHADDTRRFVAQTLPGLDSDDQVSYFGLKFSHGYLVETDCASGEVARCGAAGTTTTSWWLWNPQELDYRSAQ